jgi:hypothetical protein
MGLKRSNRCYNLKDPGCEESDFGSASQRKEKTFHFGKGQNRRATFTIVAYCSRNSLSGVIMESVSRLKKTTPKPNTMPVAASRKTATEINKTETARAKTDKTKKNEIAATPVPTEVTNEERHQLIAEAAYYRAERRNFVPGYELEDWLDAEAEINIKQHKSAKE